VHDRTVERDEIEKRPGDVLHAGPIGPWEGQIVHASGRGSDDTRGLSPAHEMTVTGADGDELTAGRIRDDGPDAVQVRVQALGVPDRHDFDRCPICGATDDLTEDHVPQGDLGGRKMTLTCKPCNNLLGARVEDELRDWFDDAVGSVRFSGGDVPGKRRSPRVLLRTTADGKFVLIPDKGKSDADIGAMLASGQAEMSFRDPEPRVWRLAALKHAYLGACVALGEIPDTPLARQIRADLVAARDARRGEAPASLVAGGLRVIRSYEAAQGPPIVLAVLVDAVGTVRDGGLSFAGTLFISWPLDAELFRVAIKRYAKTDD
jgi:hypothetical protein